MGKETHRDTARQRRRHKWSQKPSKGHEYIYIYKNKYRIRERLQPIRPAEQMSMPVRLRYQGIRWRYCRKHTGVPRSSTSLPKACRKEIYGEWTEEKRSVSVRQHFVLPNARYPLTTSPSLLQFKKGAVFLINYLPTKYNYLGFTLYLLHYFIH